MMPSLNILRYHSCFYIMIGNIQTPSQKSPTSGLDRKTDNSYKAQRRKIGIADSGSAYSI